jgi:hypothetical protein
VEALPKNLEANLPSMEQIERELGRLANQRTGIPELIRIGKPRTASPQCSRGCEREIDESISQIHIRLGCLFGPRMYCRAPGSPEARHRLLEKGILVEFRILRLREY